MFETFPSIPCKQGIWEACIRELLAVRDHECSRDQLPALVSNADVFMCCVRGHRADGWLQWTFQLIAPVFLTPAMLDGDDATCSGCGRISICCLCSGWPCSRQCRQALKRRQSPGSPRLTAWRISVLLISSIPSDVARWRKR